MDEAKIRDKELTDDRKQLQEKEKKRIEEMETTTNELIDLRALNNQLEEKVRKLQEDIE